MSADTGPKRYSAINIMSAWRGVNVVPDVTVPQGERQAYMFMYSGILAGALEVPPEVPELPATEVVAAAVRPTIDFIISGNTLYGSRDVMRRQRVQRQDAADLKEMMQLYTQWRMAA